MKSNSDFAVVVKAVGGVFTVLYKGKKVVCYSPKKFRYHDGDVLVGDYVRFDDLRAGKGVITEVAPRTNKLSRPEIANVDVCFIVVAAEPKPDFYLVDKVLINCFQQNIEPVIVVNKSDLPSDLLDTVKDNYGKIAQIVSVSAANGDVNALEPFLKGNVACFAGQSAVGKTSLINALNPDFDGKTGGISTKSGRGTHTTRHSSLFPLFGGFVADTCGFSLLTLTDVKPDQLRLYLDDFVTIAHGCRYTSCTHTKEPDCAVKAAVENGTLCKDRYLRYLEEYEELLLAEKNKY